MSWWVYLVTDLEKWDADGEDFEDAVVRVETHSEGGTHVMGGIDRAELNVTYNYSRFFYEALGVDFRDLDRQRAGDWIERLEKAVGKLGTERDEDYWARTPGNAGHALSILLGWAREHPDGHFIVH